MIPAKKKYRQSDIWGESSHFVYRLTMTLQSSIYEAGKYTIEYEKYSTYDGGLLDNGLLITDEKGKPFTSLLDVKKFVENEALDFWQNKVAFSNTENEFWNAEQKLTAWRMFYDKLNNYIRINGEPDNKQRSIN